MTEIQISNLTDFDLDVVILTGSAGTGKTTRVKEILKNLSKQKRSIRLLATTGRAAKVLSNATGQEAGTIHAEIYNFNGLHGVDTINFDDTNQVTGQLSLNFGLKPRANVGPYLYIVDEASMLTHEISRSTSSLAQYGTGSVLNDFIHFAKGSKVIFVGDPCQLPPIAENPMSSALNKFFLEQNYGLKVATITLSHVWRQEKNNEILKVATFFRQMIIERSFFKGLKFPKPEGVHVFLTQDNKQLLEAYLRTLKTTYDYTVATMICPTNKQVNTINLQLRHELGHTGKINEGELLSVVQNSHTTPLMNGDQVVVTKIIQRLDRAGFTFLKAEIRNLYNKDLYITYILEDLLYSNAPNLHGEDHKRLLVDYVVRMKDKGIQPKTREFEEGLKSDPYLNALRCKFGYAVTCHKAQGGEWDEVYLALNGSLYYKEPETAARWYYTAVTRAKKRLYINNGPWVASHPIGGDSRSSVITT